nr:MAG TPA: hypothetical protein [Bacteriophage sp.]
MLGRESSDSLLLIVFFSKRGRFSWLYFLL